MKSKNVAKDSSRFLLVSWSTEGGGVLFRHLLNSWNMKRVSHYSIVLSIVILLLVMGIWGIGGWKTTYSEPLTRSAEPQLTGSTRGWPKIGTPAPPFTLMDLHGNPIALSDFHGKVVMLNFWATWCGPCRIEMPDMEEVYQELKSQGLEIVAVSVDPQGGAVTRPFQQSIGLTFPILHDADYRVGSMYGARTLPMTYVIDRNGIIRQRIFGAREWNHPVSRQQIEAILKKTS